MAEGHVDVNVTDEVGSTCNVLQFSVWWPWRTCGLRLSMGGVNWKAINHVLGVMG